MSANGAGICTKENTTKKALRKIRAVLILGIAELQEAEVILTERFFATAFSAELPQIQDSEQISASAW